MKPVVDPNLCISCGVCVSLCPQVFEMGNDGKSHVIGEGDYQAAMEACPVEAISTDEK